MTKLKTNRCEVPIDDSLDPEVVSFRAQFNERSPLDELVREGVRRMLQSAIDAEVAAFIAICADRTDEQGRRLVVRNDNLPEREILTGARSMSHPAGACSG